MYRKKKEIVVQSDHLGLHLGSTTSSFCHQEKNYSVPQSSQQYCEYTYSQLIMIYSVAKVFRV